MKRSMLEVRPGDIGRELIFSYNLRVQVAIPLGDDPQVIESAEILAAQFNRIQPEE
jgi:hypothetical protein